MRSRKNFESFELEDIPRSENSNALAALASTSDLGMKKIIPAETINELRILVDINTLTIR